MTDNEWHDDKHGLLYIGSVMPCVVCERPTNIVDVSFEYHCCSVECWDVLDKRYWDALKE